VNRIIGSILSTLGDLPTAVDRKRDDWARILLVGYSADAIERASAAVEAADAMLLENGLRHV